MEKPEKLRKNCRGAVLLEFVMCFPLLIVLFLFGMQLAQIMITWQVVHYAAYMGARSSMVSNNINRQSRAEKVVKRILAVVSASPVDSKEAKDRAPDEYSKLDGWGWLPGTKYLEKQVAVDIPLTDIDPSGVRCTVKFKMFLNVPVAGNLIGFFARKDKDAADKDWEKRLEQQAVALNPALLNGVAQTMELDKIKYPYIELESTSVVYVPYGTKFYPVY
ncbi:MAG: pilus assembly protein [Lentisphaeria bacterium]|nr:pilus assembly protein [Lentisphaeria bacterium]